MASSHHLDGSALMSCAAGSQPEAIAAVVASHLAVCATCRAQLKMLSEVGETLLRSIEPANLTRADDVTLLLKSMVPDNWASAAALPAYIGDLDEGVRIRPLPLSQAASGSLTEVVLSPNGKVGISPDGHSALVFVADGRVVVDNVRFAQGDVFEVAGDQTMEIFDETGGSSRVLVGSDRDLRII